MDSAAYLSQQREKLENRLATAIADLDDDWQSIELDEQLDRATLIGALARALRDLPPPPTRPAVDVDQVVNVVWKAVSDAGQSTETADVVVEKLRERLTSEEHACP